MVSALALFALANAGVALAPTFSVLLLSRVAAAGLAAISTPVAVATAAQLAPPEHKGRALSVTIGGISVAWVVGVPSGAVIVDHLGWRVSFALTAGLALFAAITVGTLLPRVKVAPTAAGGLASRLAVAGRPAVLATLVVTFLAMVSGFTVLTYVRPMLEGLTGFGGEGIGSMLLLFGLAAIAGSVLGGYGADRWGYQATVVPVLVVQALALLSFSVLFRHPDRRLAHVRLCRSGGHVSGAVQFKCDRGVPDGDVNPVLNRVVLILHENAVFFDEGVTVD